MQQAVGITEPDYGTLFDDMFFGDGQRISPQLFIAPKVEVELAFILARDLSGPGTTIFDVLDATAYVVPALEIIDSRIERIDSATGATHTVRDTIADNAASAGVVVGGRPVRPHDLDPRCVGAILIKNGLVEVPGLAASGTYRDGTHTRRPEPASRTQHVVTLRPQQFSAESALRRPWAR